MKKVLVITYYWPPDGGGGVQRIAKFSKYLPRHGWEPVVLTAGEGHRAAYDTSLVADVEGVRAVRRARAWEPHTLYHRLRRSAGRDAPTAAGRRKTRPPPKGALGEYVRLNVFIPDARVGWLGPATREGLRLVSEEHPDVILSSAPPYTAHLVARRISERTGMPWVADFRDPWLENLTYNTVPRLGIVKRITANMEARVLRDADRVITVGAHLRALLASKIPGHQDKFTVITNGYDAADTRPLAPADEQFRISYFGTIYSQGFPRGLPMAIRDAAARDSNFARDYRLKLVGQVPADVRDAMEDVLPAEKLEQQPYIPHERMLEELYRPQLLLLLINDVPHGKLILTGKLFDYLPTGNPVLAVGPVDGDAAAILAETRAGNTFDGQDAEGITRFILDRYHAWAGGSLNTGTRRVETYERDHLAGKLAGVLDGMVP